MHNLSGRENLSDDEDPLALLCWTNSIYLINLIKLIKKRSGTV